MTQNMPAKECQWMMKTNKLNRSINKDKAECNLPSDLTAMTNPIKPSPPLVKRKSSKITSSPQQAATSIMLPKAAPKESASNSAELVTANTPVDQTASATSAQLLQSSDNRNVRQPDAESNTVCDNYNSNNGSSDNATTPMSDSAAVLPSQSDINSQSVIIPTKFEVDEPPTFSAPQAGSNEQLQVTAAARAADESTKDDRGGVEEQSDQLATRTLLSLPLHSSNANHRRSLPRHSRRQHPLCCLKQHRKSRRQIAPNW
jgi:hypothetical protein